MFGGERSPGPRVRAHDGQTVLEDPSSTGGLKTLLVEDEEGVRNVTRAILEKFGFTVLTASDGREGIEVFREHAEDIVAVLLDMTMPHMSGEEALRAIRGIRPETRFILSSGYTEEDFASQWVGSDGVSFIQKPYEPVTLIAKVREVLED